MDRWEGLSSALLPGPEERMEMGRRRVKQGSLYDEF
jgi:hypothetical protein